MTYCSSSTLPKFWVIFGRLQTNSQLEQRYFELIFYRGFFLKFFKLSMKLGQMSNIFCSNRNYFLSLPSRRIVGNWRQTHERIGNAVGKLLVSAAPLKVSYSMGGSLIKAFVKFYLSQC